MQQAILAGPADPTAPAQGEIAHEAACQLRAMLDGMDRWRADPWVRPATDAPVLWSDGSTQLYDFGAAGAPVVLVLPSLINRADILDLIEGRSFLRALAAEGFRPLLLDWGEPGEAEHGFGLDDYADRRLRPAIAVARVLAGCPVPLIGYCMGGALAVAAAARLPRDVRALVTLGTPWNCRANIWVAQASQALLAPNVAALRTQLRGLVGAVGALPHEVLQAAFASLDPGLALRKFAAFARLPEQSEEARIFVAVEDWLNAPVHLPGPVAETLLIDWHLNNELNEGGWSLLGGPIDPSSVTCPTLSVCATQDRIAPPDNAEALPRAIATARIIRPQTGHVGMIVGRDAPRNVIAPISRFLHAHVT